MTVTVPAGEKTGAYQLQAQITTLAALTDPGSQQLVIQKQCELVLSLIDQHKLDAGTILSTVPYTSSNPLIAQITALQTLQTSYGAGMPAGDAAVTVIQLQRQLVTELLSTPGSGMTAALVLSTMSYIGGAAQ
jgi:hypothetical protein